MKKLLILSMILLASAVEASELKCDLFYIDVYGNRVDRTITGGELPQTLIDLGDNQKLLINVDNELLNVRIDYRSVDSRGEYDEEKVAGTNIGIKGGRWEGIYLTMRTKEGRKVSLSCDGRKSPK